MKRILFIFTVILFSNFAFSQDIDKAFEYFNNEQYEKAAYEFEAAIPQAIKNFGNNDTTFYTKSISKNTILEEGITYPIDGAKDVPLGVIIKVNLDNELSLDDIMSMEFSLKDSAGAKIEGKKAVYSNYVTFTPNTLLQPSQKYSAYFSLPLQKVVHNFSFTTINY